MADDNTDDSQKTEDPTPKRLQEARKKGQVPLSRELNNWIMLLAGSLMVIMFAGSVMNQLYPIMKTYIEQAHAMPKVPGGLRVILGESFMRVLHVMMLPFLFLMAAAFFAPFLQIGPLLAPESIKPDWSKVSLSKGLGRLFSLRSIVEFLKGLMKISVVGVVGTIIIMPYFDRFERLIDMPVIVAMSELHGLVASMLIGMLVVIAVIAGIDLVYQRHEYFKKLRMSRQEIKDEYKQSEGDPQVKGRLRQLRMERARQRMMQSVPEADVVITNPTHYAIALKYDPTETSAPIVVAKGVDQIALRIREVAQENNVVLYENKPLARALYDVVEIDDMIPTEHFKAVAEIISYVFKLKGKTAS